jgi:hypothetical protein
LHSSFILYFLLSAFAVFSSVIVLIVAPFC